MFVQPGTLTHPNPPSNPCLPSGGLTVLRIQYAFIKYKLYIQLSLMVVFIFIVFDLYVTSAPLVTPLDNLLAPKH